MIDTNLSTTLRLFPSHLLGFVENPSCLQCSHHYYGDHLHHALVPLERSLSGRIPSPSQRSWLNQIVGTAPLVHSQPWIITCYWHKGGQAKWSRKKKRKRRDRKANINTSPWSANTNMIRNALPSQCYSGQSKATAIWDKTPRKTVEKKLWHSADYSGARVDGLGADGLTAGAQERDRRRKWWQPSPLTSLSSFHPHEI